MGMQGKISMKKQIDKPTPVSRFVEDDARWIEDVFTPEQLKWIANYWNPINLPNLLIMCQFARRYNRRYFTHNIMDGFPDIPTAFPPSLKRLCREMTLDLWAYVAEDREPENIKRFIGSLLLDAVKVMSGESNLPPP